MTPDQKTAVRSPIGPVRGYGMFQNRWDFETYRELFVISYKSKYDKLLKEGHTPVKIAEICDHPFEAVEMHILFTCVYGPNRPDDDDENNWQELISNYPG